MDDAAERPAPAPAAPEPGAPASRVPNRQAEGTEVRVTTGTAKLDEVLRGGFLAGSLALLIGPPGSGKTLLAQQCVFANATVDEPALYLSTVSEPLSKLMRFGRSLAFFDPAAVGERIFYEDLSGQLNQRGLPGFVERVAELIEERRPGLIVIDSFKALHSFAIEPSDFRWFLHDLAARIADSGAVALWVGEYREEDEAAAPEFAVADAIISLRDHKTAERSMRVLQVIKLRGSSFLSGRHTYRLSNEGLRVFPRLADRTDPRPYALGSDRVSSGIPELDRMLGEGYWPGAATLVAGPSGAGKTVMGLHFLVAGAAAGQQGLLASLQENPSQVERTANGFGWSLHDPGIDVMYRSAVDLYIDEWVHELLERAEAIDARRIVIDSLGDLEFAATDPVQFREYVYSMVQRLSRQRRSVVLTMETPDLFHVSRLSHATVSHLADNVLLLQYLRGDSHVRRALTVMKTRAALHEPKIREYVIGPTGIELGDPFGPESNLD